MKIEGVNESNLGRVIIIILMGGPFWAAKLLGDGRLKLSYFIFGLWLLATIPLVKWLAKERLVRKPFSIFIAAVMSFFYGVVVYARLHT